MRSGDSEIASSVPSRPSYFLGTASRSISQPVRQLADGHAHPARAKIVAPLDEARKTSGRRNSRCSLRSVERVCPSAPQRAAFLRWNFSSCALEEPVAPPQPSRPVRPPSSIDNVARLKDGLAHHLRLGRGRCNDRADLQPLGRIALVVQLRSTRPVARPIWLP